VEDDVRHHSVRPLALEEGANLLASSLNVGPGEADCNQRRVPVPLKWVDGWRGLDEESRVVSAQHRQRAVGELRECGQSVPTLLEFVTRLQQIMLATVRAGAQPE
jgi:hypothetical protein